MTEIKIGPEVVHVTPLVCTNPECNANMGAILARDKSLNDFLHENDQNFLCPKCWQTVFTKVGLSR